MHFVNLLALLALNTGIQLVSAVEDHPGFFNMDASICQPTIAIPNAPVTLRVNCEFAPGSHVLTWLQLGNCIGTAPNGQLEWKIGGGFDGPNKCHDCRLDATPGRFGWMICTCPTGGKEQDTIINLNEHVYAAEDPKIPGGSATHACCYGKCSSGDGS